MIDACWASERFFARLAKTLAPSIPTKTHIITIKQPLICNQIVPCCPVPFTRLSDTLPQKSAVNIFTLNAINTNIKNRNNGTNLQIVTIVLMTLAPSTPLFTNKVRPQIKILANKIEGTFCPPLNIGKILPWRSSASLQKQHFPATQTTSNPNH